MEGCWYRRACLRRYEIEASGGVSGYLYIDGDSDPGVHHRIEVLSNLSHGCTGMVLPRLAPAKRQTCIIMDSSRRMLPAGGDHSRGTVPVHRGLNHRAQEMVLTRVCILASVFRASVTIYP